MTKPTLDEILEPMAAALRGWAESELAGTRYYETEMKSIEDDKAKAKQQLTQLIADIIGEDERKTLDSDTVWMGAYLKGRQDLKDEQRQRMADRLNGTGEK